MPHGGERVYGGSPTFGQWAWAPSRKHGRFLYCRRGRKTLKVARLVCEAFNGPPPDGSPYCLHIDEDSRNNRPENLKWGTQRENLNAPKYIAELRSRHRAA